MGKTPEETLQALTDRAELEEMFTSYFSGGLRLGFDKFFTPDAVVDINGMVARSFEETAELYKKVVADKPKLTGQFRMILSNHMIKVDGDTATVELMWTQQLNDTIKGPPRLIEQGREWDKLVRTKDGWRITKRVVIADSGLPDLFDATYTPRRDFNMSMM